MKQCPFDQTFYEDEGAFAWDRLNEDLKSIACILWDMGNVLDDEPLLKNDWEHLKYADKQRYWKLFQALKEFLDLDGVEGERATQLSKVQLKRILTEIHKEEYIAESAREVEI